MKIPAMLKCVLLLSGAIASGIGATILTVPSTFYASYGIVLGTDPSVLSETRAAGGSLLAMGLLMMAGAFVSALTFTAILVAVFVYLSYGLSRLLSLALDGWPDSGLVEAAVLELAIGPILVVALFRYRHALWARLPT